MKRLPVMAIVCLLAVAVAFATVSYNWLRKPAFNRFLAAYAEGQAAAGRNDIAGLDSSIRMMGIAECEYENPISVLLDGDHCEAQFPERKP